MVPISENLRLAKSKGLKCEEEIQILERIHCEWWKKGHSCLMVQEDDSGRKESILKEERIEQNFQVLHRRDYSTGNSISMQK